MDLERAGVESPAALSTGPAPHTRHRDSPRSLAPRRVTTARRRDHCTRTAAMRSGGLFGAQRGDSAGERALERSSPTPESRFRPISARRTDLHRQGHVSLELELAAHERLLWVEMALRELDEVFVGDDERDVSREICRALADRARAVLQVQRPHLHTPVTSDCDEGIYFSTTIWGAANPPCLRCRTQRPRRAS